MFVKFFLPEKVSGKCFSSTQAVVNLTARAPQDILESHDYYYCERR